MKLDKIRNYGEGYHAFHLMRLLFFRITNSDRYWKGVDAWELQIPNAYQERRGIRFHVFILLLVSPTSRFGSSQYKNCLLSLWRVEVVLNRYRLNILKNAAHKVCAPIHPPLSSHSTFRAATENDHREIYDLMYSSWSWTAHPTTTAVMHLTVT